MGKINVENILKRVESFLSLNKEYSREQEILQATISFLTIVYGVNSPQMKRFEKDVEAIRTKYMIDAAAQQIHYLSMGVLRNLKAEIEDGLIGSLERQVSGEVLSDFLLLSKNAFAENSEGGNHVAAVLIAALFERVLRRLCAVNGIPHIERLQEVVIALKNQNILVGSEINSANGALKFRNDALHGKWEGLERASIASLQGFVEQLLLKHFA